MSDDRAAADCDHWLVRPSTIRTIWIVSCVVLAVTVILDLVIQHHPHFGVDGTFGFGAWYGFTACVGMVLFAKLVGMILKRPDTYYDR